MSQVTLVPVPLREDIYQFDPWAFAPPPPPQQAPPPQYYPWLVPIGGPPAPPPQPPPPVFVQRGPTEDEVAEKIANTTRSNRDVLIALIIFLIIFLVCLAVLIWILVSLFGGVSPITTTTIVETVVGFDVTRTDLTYGSALDDKNGLAFINNQQIFCDMVRNDWFASAAVVKSCMIDKFASGSVKGSTRLTMSNNGSPPSEVLAYVQGIVPVKSAAEGKTNTVPSSAITVVSTSTQSSSGASQPSLLLSALVIMLLAKFLL